MSDLLEPQSQRIPQIIDEPGDLTILRKSRQLGMTTLHREAINRIANAMRIPEEFYLQSYKQYPSTNIEDNHDE